MRFIAAYALLARAFVVAAVVLGASLVPAHAQSPEQPAAHAQAVSRHLTLREAVAVALANRPELAGFVFDLRAQDARVAVAGLRPPLEADLLVEDFAGSGTRSGGDSAQTTLSLGYVLELGFKRDARVAVADATRARLRTDLAARQLDVTADVARRFVETLRDQKRLAIAKQHVALAGRTRSAVEQRVRSARSPEVELIRAEVRVTQGTLAQEHAEHELSSSRRWLAAAMGASTVEFSAVEGNLLELHEPASLEALLARLARTPEIVRFADERRLRDSELRLAEVQRRPDIRTTLGVRHYSDGDDVALVAGFNVPLGSSRRAHSSIEAARATSERVSVDRQALLLALQAQLHAQYQELAHVLLEARTLEKDILPKLAIALEQTEYAYERGRYSLLEWFDAQREHIDAQERLVEVASAAQILRIEIERLTGESLARSGEQQ